MGFFSSIRKFFGSDSDTAQPQKTPEAAPSQEGAAPPAVSQNLDENTPSGSDQRLLQTSEPSAETPASVDSPASQGMSVGMSSACRSACRSACSSASPSGTPAAPASDEDEAMTLALRSAEPKLSAWLSIVLNGVTKAEPLLWERLAFLLAALEAPAAEADQFIKSFKDWLEDMGYEHLADFRSELQYRLALALDLEDEEDERNRLVQKLTEGLAKTREQLARSFDNLFAGGRALDEAFWEELEEVLLMADVGFEAALELANRLRRRAAKANVKDAEALRDLMRQELLEVFKPVRRITSINPPEVILVIGVNGVGKTTTIAKLCHRAVLQGKKVMLVAGDTFRAAATEQLEIWAKRTGSAFYAKGHGADPAAVAYEALEQAKEQGCDTVFVDTAGRLHTKTNLMEELTKIRRVLGKCHPGAPHRTILILDATTGQNALSQVKLFQAACGIDEIAITKLDGTAKGGIAVAVAMQYNIPISFVGLGEKMEDLRPFDPEAFVNALV